MDQGVYLFQCNRRFLPFLACVLVFWSSSAHSQEATAASATTCPAFNYEVAKPAAPSPEVTTATRSTSEILTRLQPGLLKPQVEALIKQGFGVEHIDWRASPHYRWSTHYEFAAESWSSALRRILEPYQLQLTLYANHTAVVAPTKVSVSALEVRP